MHTPYMWALRHLNTYANIHIHTCMQAKQKRKPVFLVKKPYKDC